ncbi:glycosyltransferase family 2 protein [Pseudofulvibacter geojedonensis]|uniref:Glycosyltransferase family 2 protein n=1 Tax=Pseudofulvibacter geojedonensis TaxID=1123758 RepID=A0ABW3I6D0_9FLAO
MVSILIPTYNYDITALVNNILMQAKGLKEAYEIIVCDDCSNNNISLLKNKSFCIKNQLVFLENPNNLGRTKTRQILAQKAKYNWLLFLDSDVLPKSNTYLLNYIKHITPELDLIYGGFTYEKQKPEPDYYLRWYYGKEKEDIEAKLRSKKPYKTIISANILIRKEAFLNVNSHLTDNRYGYDNYFSIQLKQHNYKVLHINNEVFHLGLEKNEVYLKKKEQAAETIYHLYQLNKFKDPHINGLLHSFLTLKKYHLKNIYLFLFKLVKPIFTKNLLSKTPSILILNLYRLGYFCSLTKQKNA